MLTWRSGPQLPAPLGGFIRPGLGSLLWTAFFALALASTWNGVEQSEASG